MDERDGEIEGISDSRGIYAASPIPPAFIDGGREGARAGYKELLDLLDVGVMIFFDARVNFMNRRAEEIIAAKDGLRIDGGGRLRAFRPADDRALQSAIDARGHLAAGSGSTVAISRPSERLPYPVTVTGLVIEAGQREESVAAFIRDPGQMGAVPWNVVSDNFDLTPTEEKLLRHLADGRNPKEAAKLLGINVSTVRWHMKQLFDKTGAGRQADLVRIVLSMAVPIRR